MLTRRCCSVAGRVGIKASMACGIGGMGKSISQATRVMPHSLYHLDTLDKIVPPSR